MAPCNRPFFVPLALLAAMAALAHQAVAQPRLEVPVDCRLPGQCLVQFYVDERAGTGIGDYRCGSMSYDNHRGTDIRVRTMADVRKGVPVVAAAAGTVVALRDDEPDIEVSVLGRDKVANKAGGNVVVIDHGQGWMSQYWHLRRGSIVVERGQSVKPGDKLAMIGMSGDASFPHLHFELSRNGSVIDPFTGAVPGAVACGQGKGGLWTPAALKRLAYEDLALIHAGLSHRKPTRIEIGDGKLVGDSVSVRKRPLNFWYELVGLRRGDTIELSLKGPDGAVLAQQQRSFDRSVSYMFDVIEFNLDQRTLEPGRYQAGIVVKSKPENGEKLPFARFARTIGIEMKP